MSTGIIAITTEFGTEEEVLKNLKNVEGVVEAYRVYGVYDIIAKIRADTFDEFKEIVTWKIPRLGKVRSKLVLRIYDEFQSEEKQKVSTNEMAFVMIITKPSTEKEILNELENVEGAIQGYIVDGAYDIVFKIGAEDADKIKETVTWQVRRLDHVRSTLTMFVVPDSLMPHITPQ
jgi:DNA-binding Lrp family transcriptional regulator